MKVLKKEELTVWSIMEGFTKKAILSGVLCVDRTQPFYIE